MSATVYLKLHEILYEDLRIASNKQHFGQHELFHIFASKSSSATKS